MGTPHCNAGDPPTEHATRRRARWPSYIGLLVLIAMLTSATGCRPASGGIDELRALPEATLMYPASEEVNGGGSDREMTIDGPQGAFTWRWLGVDATDKEIERFYAEQLGSLGWTDGGGASGIRTISEFRARAWRKGDVVFRLAFPDPEYFADPEPFSRYATIYDVRLAEARSPVASPSPGVSARLRDRGRVDSIKP